MTDDDKARPDDARACLESIVGMVAAMAPEDGSPKALEFDTLETLLYCIGHLSVKAPGMFNSLTGIKTFTGLMNDGSLEDHPDKRAAFDQKMKALVGCCKHCLPQLKKANGENQKKLKSFKGKELSEKEARAARAKETLLDEVTDSIKRN